MAVEDVNMVIEPRAVTAFIGPSGCGKSTVLRTLNRMHEVIPGAHVKGQVLLDGQDLYAENVDPVRVRRHVGMVFQKPNPFPTMSIRENVLAGVKLNGARLAASDADALVENSLPDVLLMDEPCSALDPISTLAIEDLIQELKEHYTVVIVTHNMQQAARVSDKTGFFNIAGTGKPGKLIEFDNTDKIFSNPAKEDTERYISGRFG
ncbi:membrane protein [Platysternon megacephalum]|uniref:Membrane protein n=1 Tax=Platysternon megacephalum TaxID=55544 RepID=A0A4D9DJG2_9SAUR|nr:membrane protein [Platysternon megacephalum]